MATSRRTLFAHLRQIGAAELGRARPSTGHHRPVHWPLSPRPKPRRVQQGQRCLGVLNHSLLYEAERP